MKIMYKEPYWVKFEWDITEHHDNQYVTLFDKSENEVFYDFLHKENYIITVNFKLKEQYVKDDISMIFGKPGKNMGLSYNQNTNELSFEFWTSKENESEDTFCMVPFKTVNQREIEKGITVSIVRKNNKFTTYKNFKEDSSLEFEGNLIDDYKESSFFVGCSNPDIDSEKHRYYCEMDINHLSYLSKNSDINIAKEIYESETSQLPTIKQYKDILFYYNFEFINNLGIVYDESSYNNFLERVPQEYIK